jgi:putative ABC transport system ATP-binding protein
VGAHREVDDVSYSVVVDQLWKIYHAESEELAVRAVRGISFKVMKGESLGIIGPSGCGKSTLLNILGCLDRPTSGSYELGGRNVADLDEDELAAVRNRHIGFVFQSFNLLPRMTAEENVELPLLYAATKDSRGRAREALARVGLADRARHLPNELSGGQKQRVAIARAIVTQPSFLLCDEPTGALDSKTGRAVLELLQHLNHEGTTLIMVTHDLVVARTLERALHMRDGEIVADGLSGAIVDAFIETAAEESCRSEKLSAQLGDH